MPEFPDASLEASKIVENPAYLDGTSCLYVLVRDSSMTGTFKNLMDAVNILAERGWEVINLATHNNTTFHVLLRNPYLKQKNQHDE